MPVTDDGIDTAAFLEASDGLVNMFGAPSVLLTFIPAFLITLPFLQDLLGSQIFGFVQTDLRNNIAVRSSRSPALCRFPPADLVARFLGRT